MKKSIITVVLFTMTFCTNDVQGDSDFFFLVNKNAKMPVSVKGNKSSGVFILFIHGGPGGTALQKIGLPAFKTLEQSYAMVYWDQRGSGSSQGNSPERYLTLEQFVEDLDQLVDLIHQKYNNPQIFLMGHSWGGCLGTAYLIDTKHQSKINGWIEVDGAHNNPKADSLSLLWITDYARLQINSHIDADFWTYVLNWYAKNTDFTSDQLEHYAFVEKAHGYIHDPGLKREPVSYPYYSFQYIFNSPADITAAFTNYNNVIKHFIISDIDLTRQMKSIKVPALIVWGLYDGIIPFPMAEDAYDALGTDQSQKEILALSDSGHFGFYEEPELFSDAVKAFVERYR